MWLYSYKLIKDGTGPTLWNLLQQFYPPFPVAAICPHRMITSPHLFTLNLDSYVHLKNAEVWHVRSATTSVAKVFKVVWF